MGIIKIIVSIFLPPLAAFLQVGVTKHFWINILLTLLGGFQVSSMPCGSSLRTKKHEGREGCV